MYSVMMLILSATSLMYRSPQHIQLRNYEISVFMFFNKEISQSESIDSDSPCILPDEIIELVCWLTRLSFTRCIAFYQSPRLAHDAYVALLSKEAADTKIQISFQSLVWRFQFLIVLISCIALYFYLIVLDTRFVFWFMLI